MADDFLLTPEELRLKRRRRRRISALALMIVIALVLAIILARPTRHAIRAWQARRHAAQAFALISEEKWSAARDEAVAAYQLRPTEPQALRAVARLLSRVHQSQALEFWGLLRKVAPLTREDLRDEAAIALLAGETHRAETATKQLLGSDPQPADWLLDAQVAARSGEIERAVASCEKVAVDPQATTREQLQSAGLEIALLKDAPRDKTSPVWSRITKLAQGNEPVSLDALMLLAQRVLSARKQDVTVILSPSSDFQSPEALASAIENHSLARAAHKLIALDLREYADPGQRSPLLDRAVAQFNHGNDEGVAALARWLNGRGEHQRVIDSIAISQAQKSRDIFLQYLDALGAPGRWAEIKRLLESAGFPLEPYLQAMYLARCNAQLGEKTAAANNWQRAVEAAVGDAIKLMQVAEFAEKNSVIDTADRAYAAALDQSPNLRPAYQGRLRIVQARRDTTQMQKLLAAMLKLWPNDTAIQNDEAYTRLLLFQNSEGKGQNSEDSDQKSATELRETEKLAEQLVEREPKSLPHRTLLALARLRQGLPSSALDAYGIEVPEEAITPSAAVVRAAALSANGRTDEARTLIANLRAEQLLPEEGALIEGIQSGNQEARK
jgi:hypothetical protein